MDVFVTDTKIYLVKKDASEVRLTVSVGDAQVGGTSLLLDNKPKPPDGLINDVIIGLNRDLHLKTLRCTTRVHDVNVQTNKTSVTYGLTGGIQPMEFPYDIDVNEEGGYATYSIAFVFVS